MKHEGKRLGAPAVFAVTYTALASSLYFSLGVVAKHALGMTPVLSFRDGEKRLYGQRIGTVEPIR